MIYSTTYVTLPDGAATPARAVWTQLYAVGLGLVALLVFLALDYRFLAEHSLFIYGGLVRAADLRAGLRRQAQMGAQRWIPLGVFNLQPSEFGTHRRGADARDVFRREPRAARGTRRPDHRRPASSSSRSCSSPSSRTSARR